MSQLTIMLHATAATKTLRAHVLRVKVKRIGLKTAATQLWLRMSTQHCCVGISASAEVAAGQEPSFLSMALKIRMMYTRYLKGIKTSR